MRRLSMSYGVFADFIEMDVSTSQPLKDAIVRLISEKQIKGNDLIILLAGSFGMRQGASYIEISNAESFKGKES